MAGHLGVKTPGDLATSPPVSDTEKNYSSAAPEQLTGHVEIPSKFPSQARQPKQILCTLFNSTTSKSTTEIDLRNRVHHHVGIESKTSKPNCRRTCIHCRTKRKQKSNPQSSHHTTKEPYVPVDGEQLESD